MTKKFLKNQQGQTLLELVVAVAIFTSVVVMATGIFQGVIAGQRAVIAAQNTQESMRYTLEVVSKEIRSAKKSDDSCAVGLGLITDNNPNPANKVYNTANGQVQLYFINKDNFCVVYFLENDSNNISRLKIRRRSSDGLINDSFYVTPDDIAVSNLHFVVVDNIIGAFNTIQPKVTLRMEAEAVTDKPGIKQMITIQTTISTRHYE